MKAEELMIGDYIQKDESIYKVICIGNDNIITNDNSTYKVEEVSDIDITKDSLIKSGFSIVNKGWAIIEGITYYNEDVYHSFCLSRYGEIELYVQRIYNDEWSFIWKSQVSNYCTLIVYSIRELQHLLKILDCDIEIKL